jgi:biopolymer transport protein ExbD
MFTCMLSLVLLLIANPAMPVQKPDVCPMSIEIDSKGQVFTNRFHGHYLTSLRLLTSDLHGGCYNDAHPSPVTSVTITTREGAPQQRVDAVMKILAENGWPSDKVVRR